MVIATLIAADRLSEGDISVAADGLAAAGLRVSGRQWIEPGSACDLLVGGDPAPIRRVLEAALPLLDVVVQRQGPHREKRLLVADMDSTMIQVECIDELADFAGLKAQVAEITEQAMRGELDFEAAVDARMALLEGMDEALIERCRGERVRLTPGGRTLVRTMRARGGYCVLVSGGFTHFAHPVGAQIGFDRVIANELEIRGGRLTGKVRRPVVGAAAKEAALLAAVRELGILTEQSMAVGDGANDIEMLKASGLGIAFRGKAAVRAAADASVDHDDLTALLYAQGINRRGWVLD